MGHRVMQAGSELARQDMGLEQGPSEVIQDITESEMNTWKLLWWSHSQLSQQTQVY